MNRKEVKDFVRELAGRNVQFHDYEKWVSFSCLLAPWTHESRHDRSASAGISVADGPSFYNCYACKVKGPLSIFLRRLQKHSGRDLSRLISEVEDGEYLGGSLGRWGGEDEETRLGEPLDKDTYYDLYDPAWSSAEARRYLRGRGIDRDVTERLHLLFDPADSDGDARVLFPVCAPGGELHGFTGRALRKDAKLRVRDYHGLKKKLLLLGVEHLPKRPPYIIVVEGLFDFANMFAMGYPVVATMKSDMSKEQGDIIKAFKAPVYCFYDNDDAGEKGRKSVKEELCRHVPVSKVRYPRKPRILDPETRKLRPPNDPGELNENEVEAMLRDARLV